MADFAALYPPYDAGVVHRHTVGRIGRSEIRRKAVKKRKTIGRVEPQAKPAIKKKKQHPASPRHI
jgi:hypothetical protein